MATGRDFTRFRLVVDRPLQKVVVSQGQVFERGDSVVFVCHHALNGISLSGANYKYYKLPEDETFSLQFGSVTWDKRFVKCFPCLEWEKEM